MALREERPAEFTDEERWARYFTTTSLIALMLLGGVCLLVCKVCARFRALPIGIAFSVVVMLCGALIFLVPVPEGDLWHGQGTLIAKVLMRVLIRRRCGRVYVRIMPGMGVEERKKETPKHTEKRKVKSRGKRI